MLRYIGLLCGLLMILSACGAKSGTAEEDASAALKKSLESYTNACADIELSKTKSKMAEADTLKADGKDAESEAAIAEAMELFKAEEPAYTSLNNSNEAQISRATEIAARRDAMANNAMVANPKAWNVVYPQVNQLLSDANAASAKCDPATAATNLDAANALLDKMENMIAKTVVVTETQVAAAAGVVYTVKKGDCLWNIAGKQYSNPFMWPIIYWANKSSIKDPDLIFPGQNFDIVFEFTEEDQVKASSLAKSRGPWSLYDNK